jgi:hypothetical protein
MQVRRLRNVAAIVGSSICFQRDAKYVSTIF